VNGNASERHAYWTEKAGDVVKCTECTPESHMRTIRFLLAEAYEDGYRSAQRRQRADQC
jgi:ribosomal protein S17